ncbi:MAG: restriction endonuclease [Candidatus Poribacteria bacterium]|nr:restriction endonuclease [Candidatus Poribacteria bacterium]
MRKAFDETTGQEYEIEIPSTEDVRDALLKYDYPPDGVRIKDVAHALATHYGLDERLIGAKNKHKQFVFSKHVLIQIHALVKSGKLAKLETGLVVRAEETSEGVKGGNETLGAREIVLPSGDNAGNGACTGSISPTAEESIERDYRQIRCELAEELLQHIRENSPRFFEELVLDLLVKMEYGGSREDAAKAVGRSRDGGIDGIIKEDRLGLDAIYVQAKRWDANVSRPELQKFAGALQGQRARKGIFITTSGFSRDAREFVNNIDSKIVLIDGRQLAKLMIDYNVGVSTVTTYEIKRVDSDYFIETDDSQTQDS